MIANNLIQLAKKIPEKQISISIDTLLKHTIN
jgi:hypothetical protein